MLTREAILGSNDIKYETVSVPEWGGDVRIKTMSGSERDEYEQTLDQLRSVDDNSTIRNIRACIVVFCCVDADGKQVFTKADIPALASKSGRALDRIYYRAVKLNGISAKDIDDLLKNLNGGQSDGSG